MPFALALVALAPSSLASPAPEYSELPGAASDAEARAVIRDTEWFVEEILTAEGGVPEARSGFADVLRGRIEDLPAGERAELVSGESTRPATVSSALRQWLDGAQHEDERVVLRLRRASRGDGDVPPAYLMAAETLLGGELSVLDAREQAAAAMAQRRDEALEAWEARVPAGIRSWRALESIVPLLLVDAPRDVIRSLISDPAIAGAELYLETIESPDDGARISDANATSINGKELATVTQAQQFYNTGFKGDEFLVVSEPGGAEIHVEHPGFLDDSNGPRRASNCTGLPSSSCSDWTGNEANSGTYDPHSTAVASIVAGDVTENQDGVLSGVSAERSSGVARDATLWGISGYGSSIHTLLGSEDVVALNRSASGGIDCNTYNSGAFDADAVYELGVAFVKSAGNTNNDPNQPYAWEADCNVPTPGQASGAFVVGAYYLEESIPADDPETEEREDIPTTEGRLYDGSGYGGASGDGYTRTLVDIVAPSLHANAFPHYQWPLVFIFPDMYGADWNSDGTGSESFCCTSGSTPVVTGAMGLYRQWADSVGGIASDPGILYVRFLLMGDRWDGLTSYLTTGYSARSGAGRLRLRQYDGTGLDGPYAQKAGSVCVDDGQTVYVTFNDGNALSSDIDVLKGVSWSYRTEEDDDPVFNDVDFAIQRYTGTSWVTVSSDNGTDDKRRVRLSPGVYPYRLRLTGTSVSGTDAVCGADSQRVYYSLLAEDSDREAAENLDDVRTE